MHSLDYVVQTGSSVRKCGLANLLAPEPCPVPGRPRAGNLRRPSLSDSCICRAPGREHLLQYCPPGASLAPPGPSPAHQVQHSPPTPALEQVAVSLFDYQVTQVACF